MKSVKISQTELEDKLSNVLVRQTNLSKEEAKIKLRENNFNMKKILMEELGIKKEEKDETKKTRYDLIREFYES